MGNNLTTIRGDESVTPNEEEIFLRRIDDLTAQNRRLQEELHKIAEEHSRKVCKWWEQPELIVNEPLKHVEFALHPVYARLTAPEGETFYFKSSEMTNRLISEQIASFLAEAIYKQLG